MPALGHAAPVPARQALICERMATVEDVYRKHKPKAFEADRQPSRSEVWWWFFMRISGVILVFLVLIHLYVMHLVGEGVERVFPLYRPQIAEIPRRARDGRPHLQRPGGHHRDPEPAVAGRGPVLEPRERSRVVRHWDRLRRDVHRVVVQQQPVQRGGGGVVGRGPPQQQVRLRAGHGDVRQPQLVVGLLPPAIADTVEAMCSPRPYRPAAGMDAAIDEINRGAGKRYDQHLVAACTRLVRQHGFTLPE